MPFWTDKHASNAGDALEDLADGPSGGPLKMWLAGVGLALVPTGYGIRCLITGHARYVVRNAPDFELEGSAAFAFALAHIALGAFLHFHFFWGLHPRLYSLSPLFKWISLLVLAGSF